MRAPDYLPGPKLMPVTAAGVFGAVRAAATPLTARPPRRAGGQLGSKKTIASAYQL